MSATFTCVRATFAAASLRGNDESIRKGRKMMRENHHHHHHLVALVLETRISPIEIFDVFVLLLLLLREEEEKEKEQKNDDDDDFRR